MRRTEAEEREEVRRNNELENAGLSLVGGEITILEGPNPPVLYLPERVEFAMQANRDAQDQKQEMHVVWWWKQGGKTRQPKDAIKAYLRVFDPFYTKERGQDANKRVEANLREFIQRWGPLNTQDSRVGHRKLVNIPISENGYQFSEPLALYYEFGKQLQALRTIAGKFNNMETPFPQEWSDAQITYGANKVSPSKLSAHQQRQCFLKELKRLLKATRVSTAFYWETVGGIDRLKLGLMHEQQELRVNHEQLYPRHCSVYDTLILQLIAMIMSPVGLKQCGICHAFFEVEDNRKRGNGRWLCSDDCREEAHRQNSRNSARSKASAKENKNDRT